MPVQVDAIEDELIIRRKFGHLSARELRHAVVLRPGQSSTRKLWLLRIADNLDALGIHSLRDASSEELHRITRS